MVQSILSANNTDPAWGRHTDSDSQHRVISEQLISMSNVITRNGTLNTCPDPGGSLPDWQISNVRKVLISKLYLEPDRGRQSWLISPSLEAVRQTPRAPEPPQEISACKFFVQMCWAPGNTSTTFTAKRHARVSEPQLPVGHAQQLTGEHGHQSHRWPTSLDGEKEEGKEPLFISIVRYECICLAGGQCLEVRTALGNKTQIWDNTTRNGPNQTRLH